MARAKPSKSAKTNPWSGIPAENRPTGERMAKGHIQAVEFKETGEGRQKGAVAIDLDATPIDAAVRRGNITLRQRDAALRYESLRQLIAEVGGQRDSLDMTPRGHGGSGDPSAKLLDGKADYALICSQVLTVEVHRIVKSVVMSHDAIGDMRPTYRRYRYLCTGLTALADHWQMPGE